MKLGMGPYNLTKKCKDKKYDKYNESGFASRKRTPVPNSSYIIDSDPQTWCCIQKGTYCPSAGGKRKDVRYMTKENIQ